jgi:hypothetical protein
MADDVIWNGGDARVLTQECARVHAKYAQIASLACVSIVNEGALPHNPGQPRTGQ